jgi:3-hydroxyacyl-CoA dehydrogenase
MGARIAAHLANASIPTILLDVVPATLTPQEQAQGLTLDDSAVRNRLAQTGIDAALKSRPAAFFVPESVRMITLGNFEDNLGLLRDCGWIIEAVVENRHIKRSLLEQVQQFRAAGAIVSSNTSGIALSAIANGFPDEFRQHWLGTHFFNPPRYMKLLEVIPTLETLPEVVKAITRFGDLVLGKGIVVAKDTPNFIANRIGTYFTLAVLRAMEQEGHTIEEIDALSGPVMGLPKSATFRTLDIVGLDVLVHVVNNLRDSLPGDECLQRFYLPDFVSRMLAHHLLGEKSGQGFYRKVRSQQVGGESEIETLNLDTLEYRQRQKPPLTELEMARNIEYAGERTRHLYNLPTRAGQFYRRVLGDAFHYAASRVPDIADDVVSIDRAMKWGFSWEAGPFELWDAIGIERVVEGWAEENLSVPPLVEKLLSSGRRSFYEQVNGTIRYFELGTGDYRPLTEPPGLITLASRKAAGGEIKRNPGASLIDLGDGVLCLEFHSKMNTIGADAVGMIHAGLKALNTGFEAMVIGNQGANFSAGANLMLLLGMIQEGEWDELEQAVRAFQDANMAVKYAPKPVVAAPFGLTLGGGAELCLHTAAVRAAAETYMGLVEAGVGVVPAGGGAKEMLICAADAAAGVRDADPFSHVKDVFQNIAMAKLSSSAEEARRLGYLSGRDSISVNRDRLIADAKQLALDVARLGYRPGKPRDDIQVLGQAGFSKMRLGIHLMRRADYISDHDVAVATELAQILSGGGEFTSPQRVSEQYILDLERESFLRLCGQRKTQERMQHMLKKGKPLRN